jgi:hypothetical protein
VQNIVFASGNYNRFLDLVLCVKLATLIFNLQNIVFASGNNNRFLVLVFCVKLATLIFNFILCVLEKTLAEKLTMLFVFQSRVVT